MNHTTSRRSFMQCAASGAALAALASARHGAARSIENASADADAPLYSLDPGLAYLNHGSIGATPIAVRLAHESYLRICERFPSLYMWGDAWERAREEVRGKLATFLNCSAKELAITHNTTEGFNILSHGLPLKKGDEALFSTWNHVGASKCFEYASEVRGYSVRRFTIPLDRASALSVQELVDLHIGQIKPQTRLLVIPHVDNLVGVRQPVAQIAQAAHRKGVEFVAVDGAQAMGMIPVDLDELADVDFYAASPHKWLQAPKGLGLFFVRAALLDQLRPMWVSWGQDRWEGTTRIFEDYGTRDLPAVLALGDAVDFHTKTLWTERTATLQRLRKRARQLSQHRRIEWMSPAAWELGASLYTLRLPGVDPKKLGSKLDENQIAVRLFTEPGGARLRISPNTLNVEADLDRLFEEL